jgi:hypothetical protein
MSKDKLLVMFLLFQSPKSKQKACPNKLPPVRQCLGGQHTKLLLVSKVLVDTQQTYPGVLTFSIRQKGYRKVR